MTTDYLTITTLRRGGREYGIKAKFSSLEVQSHQKIKTRKKHQETAIQGVV